MSTENISNTALKHAMEALPVRQQIKKMGLTAVMYTRFDEALNGDPRDVGDLPLVSKGLLKILAFEGPMIAKTACDRYLRAVGIGRMGREIEDAMRRVLNWAINSSSIIAFAEMPDTTDLLKQTIRLTNDPVLLLRTTQIDDDNKRSIDEIPAGEIQLVARYLSIKEGLTYRSDDLLRRTLDFFELTRLTPHTKQVMLSVLVHDLPHVDQCLSTISQST